MKLYILRWNPTFSMKYKYFNSMMDYLHDDEIDDFNWSIYDHEDLEVGDMFILAQVGTGALDGIAGFGIFNSEPYADKNWKEKDGTNRFYADMSVHCLISHEETDDMRRTVKKEDLLLGVSDVRYSITLAVPTENIIEESNVLNTILSYERNQ